MIVCFANNFKVIKRCFVAKKIKSNSSSIGDHISKFGHKASFDDFEIISKTDNHFDLLIHESLLIKRDTPSLNSQTSSIPMVLF